MWALVIGIFLLVGLLGYFLLRRRDRPSVPTGAGSGLAPSLYGSPDSTCRRPASPGEFSPVQHPGRDHTGTPDLDLAIPDKSREIKIRLQQGVDFIFTARTPENPNGKNPLRIDALDPAVEQAVRRQIRDLKNFRVTHDLCRALDNPDSSMSEFARIIVTDPILTGKILNVANSAYFGLPQKVNSIGQALMIIGLYHIKNMLYREGLAKLFHQSGEAEAEMERLWEHAVLTSICAGYIQEVFPGLDKGTVFTLGLLHDIGKFILPHLPPRRPETLSDKEVPSSAWSLAREEEAFGLNHALIGRLAFEEWEFSELMKSVVELHHAPHFLEIETLHLDGERLKYLLVLFLADQAAKLFASEFQGMTPIATLAPSYHPLVHPGRIAGLIQDQALLSEIQKSRAVRDGYAGRS